jgi:broad specificity phosphatase PhoE
VGEIPTPLSLATDRGDWLRGVLAGRWPDVAADTGRWRAELLHALQSIDEPTVVFTHFVAINAAVGAATGDDRVWSCSPAHASITELEADGSTLTLVALGAQSTSRIG